MPSEPSTRTQLYLTDAQRRRLDAFCRTRGIAMAEAVREAVDAYLDREHLSCDEALDRTWGGAPKAEVPSRDEWDAPRERGDRTEGPSSHARGAVGERPATKPASTQGPVRPSERSEAPLGGGRASRARKRGGGVGRGARRDKRKRA